MERDNEKNLATISLFFRVIKYSKMNEVFFNKEIKMKLIDLFANEITSYHNQKMEELDKLYNSKYELTFEPHIYDCDNEIVVLAEVCKFSFFFCWKSEIKNLYYNNIYANNLTLVKTKIDYSDNELVQETNNISSNFIKKFENYLGNIISYIQNLYSNLYQKVENKIQNSKIKILLDNYKNNFNNIMNENENNNILQKINNIELNLNNNLHELEKNINLLNETYFNLYYLPNNEQFIEYPEEIIFKINQFQKELIYNTDNIIKVMTKIYKNRINTIKKSTNLYINNIINQDYKYILTNINSTNVLSKYSLTKYNELKIFFENCISIVKSKNNQIYNEDNINLEENNIFSYIHNYNKSINEIINKSSNFIYYLEDIINQTFMIPSENCTYNINNYTYNYTYNNTDNYTMDNDTYINETLYNFSLCQKEKKHIGENYSKYNYNIVKLRSGIFYTKTLFENIDSFFDDINIENILNINKIIYYDNLLNDKNVFNFYNESNDILNQIKKEGNKLIIEGPLQKFIEYLNNIYIYDNDYSNLLKKFKEIISLKNNDYNNNITDKKEDIIGNVFLSLNEFNKTLLKQASFINNYNVYNINQTYFKNIYNNYYSLIEDLFKEYKNKINSLGDNYKFHNLIKKIFKKSFDKKKEYYKDIINEYSNYYILNVFDSLYDIGEYQSNNIQNLFNKYELSKKYEYVEIYEINTSSYKNKIISIINYLESKIKEKLKNIYDNFYKIFNKNITMYVNINFVEQLNNNYTTCLEYKDRESFNNKIEFINIIFENCSNETNITDIENYSLNEKINYIKENGCLSDTDNISFYNNIEYINHYNNCYNHNYYNYTAFYFNNFDNTYKSELDNIMNEILNEIKNNYIDENYLYKYFVNNYELEPYKNIEINETESYLEDIETMIIYMNNNKNDELQYYLFNSLIDSFNSSYFNLFNNFIINELTDNFYVLINKKIEIYFDYTTKKIQNEFDYYLLLLNNTDEMGDNSKFAFANLYKNINSKINETIMYLIEDEIYYYLDIFYKKNKNNFRDNFVKFYINPKNQYNINMDKLLGFIEEIIINVNFNRTLDNISNFLINKLIINKIKNTINNSLYSKVQVLNKVIENIRININNILNNIPTKELPENMLVINDLIINYTEVVNNQSNKYLLKINDKPFNLLSQFIHNDLEPPLLLIKNEYRIIEENLLNEILEIIKSFPNFYLLIKNELKLESIITNISSFYNKTNETLINYVNILDKDLESYINKLSYYTFIKGLNTYNKPCDKSFCMINLEDENNDDNLNKYGKRRLNLKRRIKNINITKKIRNLDGYNSKMGAITEEDLDSYILEIKDTLFNFNNSYLNKEYENMKKNLNFFIMKISNIYLTKLKTNIDLVASKFSTILTKDIYMQLKNKLFEQYNDIEEYILKF